MSFLNKVVIVTGAASGMGAASALKFSEGGALVVLVDKDKVNLLEVARLCKKSHVIHADITNDEDAVRIITETIQKFNKIDVLVNVAGVAQAESIIEGDLLKSYAVHLNVNLRAPIHLTKLVAPHLIKTKGNIVNISSIASQKPNILPMFSMYGVSKAGLSAFSAFAASELAPYGIRVNAISPGTVNTNLIQTSGLSIEKLLPFTALNRILEAEEIADLILYLASDKAKGITGSNIVIDNGQMMC